MATVNRETLLTVIDRIYESVEEPGLWPETIDMIGELVSGRRGFWTAPLGDPRAPGINTVRNECTFFISRADLRTLDQFANEFGELLLRFLKVLFVSMLWSPKHLGSREAIGLRMAQRFLPAFEMTNHATVPSKAAMRDLIASLWEDGRALAVDSLHSLRILAPHLDRALRMQMRLSESAFRSDMLGAALDRLSLGVVLIDRSGAPVWFNSRAQEMIGQKDGLRLGATGLIANDASETRRLREMVQSVVSTGAQGLLRIRRDAESRPLVVLSFPLKPRARAAAAPEQLVCGAIFISDPDITDDPNINTLRDAFDLTFREAQTAIAVSRGQGLQAAADTMGVALTTARSQLQQVFSKTGTHHQAELVGLLHRTLGKLRLD